MVRITLNLRRRYALLLLAVLLLGFTVAYGGNNPVVMGHSAGEMHVTVPGKGTKTLQAAIDAGDLGGSKLEAGPAVITGVHQKTVGHVQVFSLKENETTPNAVLGATIVSKGGDGDHCAPNLKIVCNAGNNFKCACQGGSVVNYQDSRPCLSPDNWHQFQIVGRERQRPDTHGIQEILWTFCDGSPNAGTQRIEVNIAPYVLNVEGRRIAYSY